MVGFFGSLIFTMISLSLDNCVEVKGFSYWLLVLVLSLLVLSCCFIFTHIKMECQDHSSTLDNFMAWKAASQQVPIRESGAKTS